MRSLVFIMLFFIAFRLLHHLLIVAKSIEQGGLNLVELVNLRALGGKPMQICFFLQHFR